VCRIFLLAREALILWHLCQHSLFSSSLESTMRYGCCNRLRLPQL
jgi:hypothetical protein